MKIFFLSFATISALMLTSCGGKTDTKEATAAKEGATSNENSVEYSINTENSIVNWKGGKKFEDINKPDEGHYGHIKLKDGHIKIHNGILESGKFIVDFSSFESKDLDSDKDSKNKLETHLKSSDFLDVEKYPTATFEITEVKTLENNNYNTEISGNLDFRGIPKNITLKANVNITNDNVTIKTEEFGINRKDFGITFKGAGGSIIKDEILLQADITAKPTSIEAK